MLKEGDQAPPFSLESDAGKQVSLDDFSGVTLVVYFYPKDDTPGCTVEAKEFAAAAADICAAGARVVGISKDSVKSHCRFRDKYGLNFPLLSDPDLKVHEAFGSYGEKTMYGKKVMGTIRSTFLVEDGTITRVWPGVKVAGHVEAVLAALREERAPGGSSKAPPASRKPRAKVVRAALGAEPDRAPKKPAR